MSSYSSLYWVQSHFTEFQYLVKSFELLSLVRLLITASRQSSTFRDAGCFLSRSGNCSCITFTASSVLPSPIRWVQRILIASAWTCIGRYSHMSFYCYSFILFLRWQTWELMMPGKILKVSPAVAQCVLEFRTKTRFTYATILQQQKTLKLILGQRHSSYVQRGSICKKRTILLWSDASHDVLPNVLQSAMLEVLAHLMWPVFNDACTQCCTLSWVETCTWVQWKAEEKTQAKCCPT